MRRRVDWAVILGSEGTPPAVIRSTAQDQAGSVLSTFDKLLSEDDLDTMLKRSVELARKELGLERAALFLLNEARGLMLGTWGTDLHGNTVDEHHVMYDLGQNDKEVFRRAEEQGLPFTVFDNCPIVEQRESSTEVVGQGWVACTPIRGARGNIGMLFNDVALTGKPVDSEVQIRAALLCSFLGVLLDGRAPQGSTSVALDAPAHPVVTGTLRLLAKDPSLGGKELASHLSLSLSRLARVFKQEMGMSLVEYRNRLRLERFDLLVDAGGDNLMEAAREAGFGSYSQFHRVFRALRGKTASQHLKRDRTQMR